MNVERHTSTGWWLEEAGRPPEPLPLEGSIDADVVVVGGGYTGLWTAWHLLALEPALRVVLLEAGRCGHGPSGRNGGFCESLWLSAPALRERFGDEPARRLLDASGAAVAAIGAWCAEHGVDAWFRRSGYLCVSTAPAFDEVGRAAVAAAAALGAPERVVDLDRTAVRARCDAPSFRRGVLVGDCATLQPARLALGLRRRVAEAGALVRERSRVRSLRSAPGGVVARTAGGSVRATAAVLAVGPAARGLAPLRSRLAVASSHVVLTEPVPDVLEELGWTGGECVSDGRLLVHYLRTTPDGRIAFGWGGGRIAYGGRLGARVERDRRLAATVARHLVRMLPALRGRRIEHAWGGPIDVSPSHLPQLGTLPGAPVHFALGYTGNGVGPAHLAARSLASLALDRRDDAARLPIVEAGAGAWVPPEPAAWLGGSLARAALVRAEARAEEGGRAGALTRALAALPRALGIHVGR